VEGSRRDKQKDSQQDSQSEGGGATLDRSRDKDTDRDKRGMHDQRQWSSKGDTQGDVVGQRDRKRDLRGVLSMKEKIRNNTPSSNDPPQRSKPTDAVEDDVDRYRKQLLKEDESGDRYAAVDKKSSEKDKDRTQQQGQTESQRNRRQNIIDRLNDVQALERTGGGTGERHDAGADRRSSRVVTAEKDRPIYPDEFNVRKERQWEAEKDRRQDPTASDRDRQRESERDRQRNNVQRGDERDAGFTQKPTFPWQNNKLGT